MSSFKFDMSGILKNLAEKEIKTRVALNLYADTCAKKVESKAKASATWVDQTGMARKSLKGTSTPNGTGARIELSHGVSYGIYLEMCNEKKYAIVKKTIDAESPAIFRGLNIIWK